MTEILYMCRACLATNVDLYNVNDEGLAVSYSDIVGVPASSTSGLPAYLCEQCYQLTSKFKEFRVTCLNSLQVLQNLIEKKQLTAFVINQVEKQKQLNLNSLIPASVLEPNKLHMITVADIHEDAEPDEEIHNHSATNAREPQQIEIEVPISTAPDILDLKHRTIKKEYDNDDAELINEELFTITSDTEFDRNHKIIKTEEEDVELISEELLFDVNSDDDQSSKDEVPVMTIKKENNIKIKTENVDFDDDTVLSENDVSDDEEMDYGGPVAIKKEDGCSEDDPLRIKDHSKRINEESSPNNSVMISRDTPGIRNRAAIKRVFAQYIDSKTNEIALKHKVMGTAEPLQSDMKPDTATEVDEGDKEAAQKKNTTGKEERLTKEEEIWIKNAITFFDNFKGMSGLPSWNYATKRMQSFEDFAKKHDVDIQFLTKEEQIEQLEETKRRFAHQAYQCQYCYQGCRNKDTYETHMLVHDPAAGDHKCDICGVRQKSNGRLSAHIKDRHSARFTCKSCGKVTNNFTAAQQHFLRHGGTDQYHCDPCNRTFKNVTNYSDHMRYAHNKNGANCLLCEQTFRGEAGLRVHMNRKHRNAVMCDSCNLYFDTNTALAKHLENSTDGSCIPGIRSCKKCGEGFESEEELKEHRQEHRYEIHTCVRCKAAYLSASSLSSHWKQCGGKAGNTGGQGEGGAGEGGAGLVCDLCGKEFKLQKYLAAHMVVHTGEKPHKCSLCAKSFRKKVSLNIHLSSHSDVKQFQCETCLKFFRQKHHLQAHLLTHTQERPFACTLCPNTYKGSGVLKEHVDTIHKGLPSRYKKRKIEANQE